MKKTIVLIVGPSGSGKTTLMYQVFQPRQFIRSATTRPMRPTEQKNVDYLFIDQHQFDDLIKKKSFRTACKIRSSAIRGAKRRNSQQTTS